MLEQIKVDLLRMKKSKLTWFLILAQIVMSVLGTVFLISDSVYYMDPKPPEIICLEALMMFGMLTGFVCAAVSVKLTILEKKVGILRNKIVIGVKRSSIFCSKVIVNYLFSVLLYVIHLILVFAVCAVKNQGKFADPETILKLSGIYLLWMLFFSIIVAIIGLGYTHDVLSIIFSFGTICAMTLATGLLRNRIEMEKYKDTLILDVMKFLKKIDPYEYIGIENVPEAVANAFENSLIPALSMIILFFVIGCFVINRKEFD